MQGEFDFNSMGTAPECPMRASVLRAMNAVTVKKIRVALRRECRIRGWAVKLLISTDPDTHHVKVDVSWRDASQPAMRVHIFYDFPPSYGDEGAVEELKAQIARWAGINHPGGGS
jgi:hypothetical protein